MQSDAPIVALTQAQLRELIDTLGSRQVQREAFSVRETAEILGVSERMTRRLVDSGQLRSRHIGTVVRIRRQWIEEYLEAGANGGTAMQANPEVRRAAQRVLDSMGK